MKYFGFIDVNQAVDIPHSERSAGEFSEYFATELEISFRLQNNTVLPHYKKKSQSILDRAKSVHSSSVDRLEMSHILRDHTVMSHYRKIIPVTQSTLERAESCLFIRYFPFFQLTPNGEPDLKALYDEELAVAKDAISNLRSSFK